MSPVTCNPYLIKDASCNEVATHVVEKHKPYAVMTCCKAHAHEFVLYVNADKGPANVWDIADWEAAP